MDFLNLSTWPSLPATISPFANLTLQPLAVLVFAVLLSLSYRYCKTLLNNSPKLRQMAINLHAVLTESCQLLLLVIAPINTAAVVETVLSMMETESIFALNMGYWIQAFVVMSLIYHHAALNAVDRVETWILLDGPAEKKQQRQRQGAPLIITRNILLSIRRHINKRRNQNPKKAAKDAITRTRPKKTTPFANRAALLTQIARLQYLDLPDLEVFPPISNRHAPTLPPAVPRSNTISRNQRGQRQQTKDLPNPPDSNEARKTKRVK